ncbi:MAG: exodeoxyribonuclease VII small subunit [Dethiobacteria bacterium]|jgi:exodeoxyribonuclease VII small subunit
MGEEKKEMMSFEEALKRLEELIEKMEGEDLTLNESLDNFQEGMELARYCRQLLTEAEYKVEILLRDGELVEFKEAEEL